MHKGYKQYHIGNVICAQNEILTAIVLLMQYHFNENCLYDSECYENIWLADMYEATKEKDEDANGKPQLP